MHDSRAQNGRRWPWVLGALLLTFPFAGRAGADPPAEPDSSFPALSGRQSSEDPSDDGEPVASEDTTGSDRSSEESGEASAEEDPEGSNDGGGPSALDAPPPRPVPDYDGRPPPPPRPIERAAWVPRVLLYPLYVVAEFLIRMPLGYIVTRAEEVELPQRVVEFFRFGPRNNLTMAPTFAFDFGFRPNVGLLFRAEEVGHPGHTLSALAAFGGIRWYLGQVGESLHLEGAGVTIEWGLEAISRPDGLFLGIGRNVDDANRSRFHWVGYQWLAEVEKELWRESSVTLATGYRFRRFDDDVGTRTSIQDRIDQGRIEELPPGFVDGYSIWQVELRGHLDTRKPRPAPGSGIRLSGSVLTASDVGDRGGDQSWVVYGGAVEGFVDLSGHNHVLELGASVVFSDAWAGEIPFTELPSISGNGPMHGFVGSYLIGQSGATMQLHYTWPVWIFLDGKAGFAVGNVFDGHLDGFALDRLRMSFDLGLAMVSERQHSFEFIFGLGTDTFESGPDIESVRLMLGATREF